MCCNSACVSMCVCVHVCVRWRQDCSQHSWSSASFEGLGRTVLKGPGDGGEQLYLSPRMAYWLSSCNCCIEAPLLSSLPRFLCFTTSKVFSISLSLKHNHVRVQSCCDQKLYQTITIKLHSLACLHVLGGGQQRWELCVTEDLRRPLGVHSFGGGQPSPWRAIYPSRLRFRHLFLLHY